MSKHSTIAIVIIGLLILGGFIYTRMSGDSSALNSMQGGAMPETPEGEWIQTTESTPSQPQETVQETPASEVGAQSDSGQDGTQIDAAATAELQYKAKQGTSGSAQNPR